MLQGFTPPLNIRDLRLISRAFADPQWFARLPGEHVEPLYRLVLDATRTAKRYQVKLQATRTLWVITERRRLLEVDPARGGSLRIAGHGSPRRPKEWRHSKQDAGRGPDDQSP